MAIMARVPIPSVAAIKRLRERLGLTQTEAADLVGVGQAVWSTWELGLRRPSRQSAILLELLRRGKLDKFDS
jgi:DNA-binding transcriptional regulator YiaG